MERYSRVHDQKGSHLQSLQSWIIHNRKYPPKTIPPPLVTLNPHSPDIVSLPRGFVQLISNRNRLFEFLVSVLRLVYHY
jgi:hypothetical protein